MTATAMTVEEFKVTELGPLPPEWEVVRLGNVAKVASGGSAPQGKEFFDGQNPFIRVQHLELESDTIRRWDLITDEAVNKCSLRLYSKETIVFPKSGASIYLEKRAILPIDAYLVGHLCAVISRSPLVDQNFLFYYLRFVRLSEQKAEGYPTLNLTEIKERRIACPLLLEQRKIAYVLSTVQTAIEKTAAVIKATRELKKSLMKHLFTYGPVSVDEVENVPLKETGIGFVPEEWEVINLGEYCNLATGKLNANQAVPGGLFPFFTCSQETYRIDRYSFDCEAVLLAGNNARGIYSVKYYSGKFDAYQRTYVITISDNSKLDYLYLKNALETKLEELRIGSIGTSTQFLTLKMLLNLRIPLPPLSLQIQMANLFLSVEHKAEAEENKKKALEALFRTLLSKLMTGKTRVNDLEVSV